MKIGIMVPFFTEIPIRRRMELIKKAGFTSFMMPLDREHEKYTAKLEELVAICNELGLDIGSGHAPYKEPEISEFWSKGQVGDGFEKSFIETIKFAASQKIKTVVFHLHHETNYTLNVVGLNRLQRMIEVAEKVGVNIAVENLYSYDELEYIFNNLSSPRLGMCYDTGHENFLTPNANFLAKYPDKLFCLHLHDNNGIQDEHKMPFTGTIDWNNFAKNYSKANQVNLDGEIKIKRPLGRDKITEDELFDLLKQSYKHLQKLEKLIKEVK